MNSKFFRFLFMAFLLSVFIQTSCEKEYVGFGPEEDDYEAIKAIVYENSFVFFDLYFDTSLTSFSCTSFYREINNRQDSIPVPVIKIDTLTGLDYVELTISAIVSGSFHVLSSDSIGWEKGFRDSAFVKAEFERLESINYKHRGWVLTKFGGTEINSTPKVNVPRFTYVKLFFVSDSVIYYPATVSDKVSKWELLEFSPGDSITVIVHNLDTTDVLYLHYFNGKKYQKRPFKRESYDFFSWWEVSGGRYFQHVFIDMLRDETVYDSTSAYRSACWGIVYKVK